MTKFQDDRTEAQRATHRFGVAMTDAFMSGWGGAQGGTSVAIWACQNDADLSVVERWVSSRREARRVRIVDLASYRPRSNVAHVHVYVVEAGHVALRGVPCGSA